MKRWSFLLFALLVLLTGAVACTDSSKQIGTDATDGISDSSTATDDTEGNETLVGLPETEGETRPDLRPVLDIPTDAAAVDALIASVDVASPANESKMDLAYLGYWSLSEEERAKVTGYDDLVALLTELPKAYITKAYKDTRVPHHKLLLGAYYGPPVYNDDTMKELVDANIDMIWAGGINCETPMLEAWDMLNRYGIGMINAGGLHIGTNPETGETVIADSPNLWGVHYTDEPPIGLFDTIADYSRQSTETWLPEVAYFDNLFPIGAKENQLGIADYRTYLTAYLDRVTTDILCYDHYPYVMRENQPIKHLNNYVIARDLSLQYDKDFWYIGQVNNISVVTVSTDQLRYQAYSALAFGAKSITWACWNESWWLDNVYMGGVRTEQYEKIVEVNGELSALGPIYMRYTAKTHGYLINDSFGMKEFQMDEYLTRREVAKTGMAGLDQRMVTDWNVKTRDTILIGQLDKTVGDGTAYMLLNITDHRHNYPMKAEVTFRTVDPAAIVIAYVKGVPTLLNPDIDGVYTVTIENADGVFLTGFLTVLCETILEGIGLRTC